MQLLLAIPMGAQAVGSFARIQSFLQLSEVHELESLLMNGTSGAKTSASKDCIVINNSLLSDISEGAEDPPQNSAQPLHFAPNSIIAITGPVGCGKSTILKSLLSGGNGSDPPSSPSETIAYCSQTPWIFEGSIRDNIVGPLKFYQSWYKRVVRACELEADIDRMPDGDATEVGSGGSKLSGGQRQRIVSKR